VVDVVATPPSRRAVRATCPGDDPMGLRHHDPPTDISFGWIRDQGRVRWFVKKAGLERGDLLDNCE
jgi:hypothetical protein